MRRGLQRRRYSTIWRTATARASRWAVGAGPFRLTRTRRPARSARARQRSWRCPTERFAPPAVLGVFDVCDRCVVLGVFDVCDRCVGPCSAGLLDCISLSFAQPMREREPRSPGARGVQATHRRSAYRTIGAPQMVTTGCVGHSQTFFERKVECHVSAGPGPLAAQPDRAQRLRAAAARNALRGGGRAAVRRPCSTGPASGPRGPRPRPGGTPPPQGCRRR